MTWNNKGLALYKLEQYEEALKCCYKALDINPEYEKAKETEEKILEAMAE